MCDQTPGRCCCRHEHPFFAGQAAGAAPCEQVSSRTRGIDGLDDAQPSTRLHNFVVRPSLEHVACPPAGGHMASRGRRRCSSQYQRQAPSRCAVGHTCMLGPSLAVQCFHLTAVSIEIVPSLEQHGLLCFSQHVSFRSASSSKQSSTIPPSEGTKPTAGLTGLCCTLPSPLLEGQACLLTGWLGLCPHQVQARLHTAHTWILPCQCVSPAAHC